MKTRTKRVLKREDVTVPNSKAANAVGVVQFIDVRQAGMVVLRENDGEPLDVEGAYVKVAPTVRTSERFTVDQKLVRERLLGAGAVAVVVAPVVVPDAPEARTEALGASDEARSPEWHLRDWFAGAKAADPEVIEEALGEALATVGAVGL